MGQQTEARAFSVYLSNSGVDHVQALARELKTEDLTLASALRLGRCTDAPSTLDKEAMDSIETDASYLEAEAQWNRAKEECIQNFGTMAAAREAKDISYTNYVRAMEAKNKKWCRLAELKFRAYREKAVNDRTAARPREEEHNSPSDESIEDEIPCMDESVASIIEDFGHLTAEQVARVVSTIPQDLVAEARKNENYNEMDDLIDQTIQNASNEKHRMHRLFRLELDSMVGLVGRSNTRLTCFSPYHIHLKEKYDSVTADCEIASQAVAELLLNLLSSERGWRQLPDRWISRTDKSTCLVCSQPLEPGLAYAHTQKCLAKADREQANAAWESYLSTLPAKCINRFCTKDLTEVSPIARQRHIMGHFRTRLPRCQWDDCREEFPDRTILASHVYNVHSIVTATASSISMNTRCLYCQDLVASPIYSPDRLRHFQSHLGEALQHIKDYGYAGVRIGHDNQPGVSIRTFVPPVCIFCFHNETLDAERRLDCPQRTSCLSSHLKLHTHHAAGAKIYCPASSNCSTVPLCTYSLSMTPDEALKHVNEVHYGLNIVNPLSWSEKNLKKTNAKKRKTLPVPRPLQPLVQKGPREPLLRKDMVEDLSERVALGEKSPNTCMESRASMEISKESDLLIDPALR